jgi:hypothetical protein
MSRPAATLTLICAGTAVLLFLSYVALPKSGMEQLAVVYPWLLVLGAHAVLGPIAIALAVSAGHPARHAWIYLYFVAFVGFLAVVLVKANELDTVAAARYQRAAFPEEWALAEALEQAAWQTPGCPSSTLRNPGSTVWSRTASWVSSIDFSPPAPIPTCATVTDDPHCTPPPPSTRRGGVRANGSWPQTPRACCFDMGPTSISAPRRGG